MNKSEVFAVTSSHKITASVVECPTLNGYKTLCIFENHLDTYQKDRLVFSITLEEDKLAQLLSVFHRLS